MEEQVNGTMNYDLLCDREGPARKIFDRINKHMIEAVNRGMVWRVLASEQSGERLYSMHTLTAATGKDRSSGPADVSRVAGEGFEHHLVSGVGIRCISEGDQDYYWQVESIWDTVDINDIHVAQDYEWSPVNCNGKRDAKISTEDSSITVWWRVVKDWSDRMLSFQYLCSNYGYLMFLE